MFERLQRVREYHAKLLAAEGARLEREECAKLADEGAEECLRHVHGSCTHAECEEQRSMSKACRNIAAAIRARGEISIATEAEQE